MILSYNVCFYLVYILSRFSTQVLQRKVSNDLAIVTTAHVQNQESILFKGIDLM